MMNLLHLQEVVASVYSWALADENIQRELIDKYFEHIHKENKKITPKVENGKTNKDDC